MGHCKAIVFRCMDYRIDQAVLARLLAESGACEAGQFDLVSLAGAAKSFPEEKSAELLLQQIEIAKSLHGISRVVLVMYDRCGAYNIMDAHEEEGTQIQDLRSITALLAKRFPTLTVERFILKGTATGEFSLERV